uniref:Capsule polysaccharide biosynthesis protein n=1 Tax=Caulobacter sp. (strain K31) TaxID=366602 RepID=B0T7Q8_CAUSK
MTAPRRCSWRGPRPVAHTSPIRPGRREILFLQGPPGCFFRELARQVEAEGHGVHRINFNGGDALDWRGGGINYRGGVGAWPSFLARLLLERDISDVVLFGDCRPIHRAARGVAAGLGLTVHVFEEGYIRPNWVTLERGGVNGFSTLSSDPQWYLDAAERLAPIPEHGPLPSAIDRRARASVAYHLATVLSAAAFSGYRNHRPWHPAAEAAGWAGRWIRRRLGGANPEPSLDGTPYFLLPLQLDSDYQLRTHSDYEGMQPALAQVIASFARHAPVNASLVVKEHPLDNGLRDWRRRTLDYARALNVSDRVVFLDTGDIDTLVGDAQGVVTINSTTGTLALAAGVPVATLGRAIYNIAGLTHRGPLDTFWRTLTKPDPRLYEAFRRVLASRCLLWGGFYDLATRQALVRAATERMLGPRSDTVAAPKGAPPFVRNPAPPALIAAE